MKCSTTGTSATVSSVTLSRVSEIIAQQSLTSMRPPSTSKAHNAKEKRHVTHCLSTWTRRYGFRDVCHVFRQCRFPDHGDRARQVSRYARRLQRLPHAGIFFRQTRHDALPRRLRGRIRNSRPWRVLWPQSDAGPRYWPRPMVDGRNRDCDHQGPATGRPRACADHALACIRKPRAAGRACDHKLSQELAVGKEQSSWALWSEREANLIRDEDRSG